MFKKMISNWEKKVFGLLGRGKKIFAGGIKFKKKC